jgi:hypothetical protein
MAALLKAFLGSFPVVDSMRNSRVGEVAEWLKAHAWKACLGETLT